MLSDFYTAVIHVQLVIMFPLGGSRQGRAPGDRNSSLLEQRDSGSEGQDSGVDER